MNARAFRIPVPVVALLGLLAAGFAYAADNTSGSPKAPGGKGPEIVQRGLYDPEAVETIAGEVLKVDKVIPMRGRRSQVHLLLKTEKEEVPVHLGPVWYLDRQEMKFAPKDRIEVKGSRIRFKGMPAFVAGEVKKGDAVLTLRDGNGYPVWAGGVAK